MKKLLLFLLFLGLPFNVLAKDDVTMSSGSAEIEDFVFHVAPETSQQGVLILKNVTKSRHEVTVYVGRDGKESREDAKSLKQKEFFGRVRFYPDAPPKDYQEDFEKSDDNIQDLCARRDENEALDAWCDGEAVSTITIDADQNENLAYVVSFGAGKQEQTAYFIGEYIDKDEKHVSLRQKLSYQPEIQRVAKGVISKLVVKQKFDVLNVWQWMRVGFRDVYIAEIDVENHGTGILPVTTSVVVEPALSGQDGIFSQKGDVVSGTTSQYHFDQVNVPRFGTVRIHGLLTYKDVDGKEQIYKTESAQFYMMPVREVMLFFVIVMMLVGIRLYRQYRRVQKCSITENTQTLTSKDAEQCVSEHYDGYAAQKTKGPKKVSVKNIDKKVKAKDAIYPDIVQQESIGASTQVEHQATKMTTHKKVSQLDALVQNDNTQSVKDITHVDIDWMQDGDRSFEAAMHMQERRLNIKVIIFIFVFMSVAGLMGFLIFSRDVVTDEPTTAVSITELIGTEDEQGEVAQEEVSKEPEKKEAEENDVKSEAVDSEKAINPEKITVQVLNAGAAAGSAGAMTTSVAQASFKTLTASNAQNDSIGTVIYYADGAKKQAEAVEKVVRVSRKDSTIEVADGVSKKYKADVVVVLGK